MTKEAESFCAFGFFVYLCKQKEKMMEYYVWKSLVIKKVQKEKNGTITVHEVTSIEQPASIDPTMFKLPSGFTVK